MLLRQITIVGTGLMGGSLALALRKGGFRGKIVGSDRPEVLRRAKRMGAITEGIADPVEASLGSGLVVLAAPVGAIIELLSRLGPHLQGDALVTDLGSTKSEIVEHAGRVFGDRMEKNFLAGHPMAGKESSGIESADPDLFRGAVWFLTPVSGRMPGTVPARRFVSCLRRTGAKIRVLDPREHDQLCAWISHVPQMIATALAASLVDEYGEQAPLVEWGGRAFAEMTRIAASPYSMWRDIALTNKAFIADALVKLEQRLAHLRENLDTRGLEEEFERAHKLRSVRRRKPYA
ncbi:MAG: prephenate dehydrogenase [Acidobacteria bacterium]|nr:prephenate dehydrogenase [Acidobacteriota bacterium]